MEEQFDSSGGQSVEEAQNSPLVEQASVEFLARWQRLISTTNWEKGHIIQQWREALIGAGAPPADCTDEAWSNRVGNVTPQHTGRLRRVYIRFAETRENYSGLYWSHFQAAVDWNDAETWLEGAVQSGWSVAKMRDQRWEAIGAPADKKPREQDIIVAELDEDVDATADQPDAETVSASLGEVRPEASLDGEPSGQVSPADQSDEPLQSDAAVLPCESSAPVAEPIRPFEDLPPLPSDLEEAFESFKLCIVALRVEGWRDFSAGDMLSVLESLKQLVMAPAEG
jgi:hypothetical protein